MIRTILIGSACGLLMGSLLIPAQAQEWTQPVRGSWVRTGAVQPGDIVLEGNGGGSEIVVAASEDSAVRQAAVFLAGDIEKISGFKPPIVARATGQRVAIHLVTLGTTEELTQSIPIQKLAGQWEAYQVKTEGNAVWLVGSNFRGTAFAAYTLSERLGIDPLYLWTGYVPEKHSMLVLKQTDFLTGPPTFKYRGFFHDDEDILPRPFDENGYPLQTGTVPTAWYERFFETALRLRMNMVAPYVRVQRPYEVQKMASDWGLFYTSHHYDSLLSNPWGFARFGLAAARNAGTDWDWFKNREGMLNFWRGGVVENRNVNSIWPVGLRGTQDRSYTFPDGMSDDDKNKAYTEAINEQVKIVKSLLPPDKTPLFHFTLYTEMLPTYGSNAVNDALTALNAKFQRRPVPPFAPDLLRTLRKRDVDYQSEMKTIAAAKAKMTPDRQQYFYEHVEFPLLVDWRQSTAAIKLIAAVAEPDANASRKLSFAAFDDLKTLEDEIKSAERPPFENWYRKTWVRNDESPYNLHRSYEHTRTFLVDNYLKP